MEGRTIALVGDTGSGKTTQIGELAKHIYKTTGKFTKLNTIDRGGYESIQPHIRVGIIKLNKFDADGGDDPWVWLNGVVSGAEPDPSIGLFAFDSGTSAAEVLLTDCARLGASGQDIGGRPTPKLVINKGQANAMRIGTNVDTHYGVVQQFTLEMIRKSTWLTKQDADVLWTFSLYRGDAVVEGQVLGMKLVGKALTATLPKEFQYTFRTAAIPEIDKPPRHVLYLNSHSDGGMMGVGNARYALDAITELPLMLDPASVVEALTLIEQGQQEAEEKLREELGL